MKRDWRPTLALIAALVVSLVLVWLGREVGAHGERDAALIARLTRDDSRLGSPLYFGRALAPIDARYVDASGSADAGAVDAYEAPDLAAPVIRRYCDAIVRRILHDPMLYELRREPELPVGFVDDGQQSTAQVGEDCQRRRCEKGLSCSWFAIERDASFEIGYVCREPVGEGLECSVDSDCTEGLLCGNRYEVGRCEPHLCYADPIFPWRHVQPTGCTSNMQPFGCT